MHSEEEEYDDVVPRRRSSVLSFPSLETKATADDCGLFLQYETSTLEDEFWNFNMPSLGSTTTTMLALVGLGIYIAFIDPSSKTLVEVYGAAFAFHTWLTAIVAIFMLVVHLIARLFRSFTTYDGATTLSQVSLFATLAAATTYSVHIPYVLERSRDCLSMTIANDESREYSYYHCHHFLQGWVATLVTIGVAHRLSLLLIVALNSCIVLSTAAMSAGYKTDVTVNHIQLPYVMAIAAFTTFLRYHRERMEREHFEVHLQLEREIASLRMQQTALQTVCLAVLPSHLLHRVGNASSKHIDHNSKTVILCVSMHDFARYCTTDTPLTVARMLDTFRDRLRSLADNRGLQCVSLVQDQMIAVGNLLLPMPVSTAIRASCQLGLETTKMKSLDEDMPPLCAAVHVGPVGGGFVGRRWVRYDVVGPGVSVCRAALLAAEPETTVVTEDALKLCNGSVLATVAVHVETDNFDGAQVEVHVVEATGEEMTLDSMNSGADSTGSHPSLKYDDGAGGCSGSTSELVAGLEALNQAKAVLLGLDSSEIGNADGDSGGKHQLVTQWCFFDRFADDSVEKTFLDHRAVASAPQAARTFLAFGWLVAFYFIVLMIFFQGPRAPLAAGLLAVGIVLCAAAGVFPTSVSQEVLLKHHGKWSVSAVFVPLFVLFACAIARPSMVGNELSSLIVTGTFVRSTCFRETKYQLIAKPVLLILSQMHAFLPGTKIQVFTIVVYVLVLWTIAIDRDVDRAERRRYVLEARLRRVFESLSEEKRVREGLLQSTLPAPIYGAIQRSEFKRDSATKGVSETAVMLISFAASGSVACKTVDAVCDASRKLGRLEDTLDRYRHLTLVSVFGDLAVIVSPVAIPGEVLSMRTLDGVHLVEAVSAAVSIAESKDCGVLLEYDETLQLTRMGSAPSFTVFGPAMTRSMGIVAAVDRAALHGALVTERVLRVATEIGACDEYNQTPFGRMKLRGVGMIRLTRLTRIECEKSESSGC